MTMTKFAREGWICAFPYSMSHYMVEHSVYNDVESGSLCNEFGWIRGRGLQEKPLDFKPVCKKCKKRLEEIIGQNKNG